MLFLLLSWEQFCRYVPRSPFSSLHHQNWELAAQHLFVTYHPIFQLEVTIQLRWRPELPQKKRMAQHLGVSQVHTVIHSLFHDWSIPVYISVLVTFLMQVFLAVAIHFLLSQTSLSSLSMIVLNRDYCLITPSGTWLLLIFTLFPHGPNNETMIRSKWQHRMYCIHHWGGSDRSVNRTLVNWVHQPLLLSDLPCFLFGEVTSHSLWTGEINQFLF